MFHVIQVAFGRWQLVCEVHFPLNYPREPLALSVSESKTFMSKDKKTSVMDSFNDLGKKSGSVEGSSDGSMGSNSEVGSYGSIMDSVLNIMKEVYNDFRRDHELKVGLKCAA